MIIGLGIDSIEIARVAQKCAGADSRFAQKMFTPAERERAALKLHTPYEHLAACFAAREAFFKATQIWYQRSQVSVGQHASGEPYYILAPEIAAQLGARRVLLSLTHDRTHATAVCVCEDTGGAAVRQ
jgi:holo-[acyl-carrier protein] synthase